MSRRFFHCVCVVLLLVAQQGALVHATWHAHEGRAHAPEHAHDGDHGSPSGHSSQGSLWAFDIVFDQVLGGVHGACALPVAVELPAAIASY